MRKERNTKIRLLSKIVIVAMLVLTFSSICLAANFSDLDSTHWAYKYIQELANDKVILGYPDGTFGPQKSVTKGEFIKLVVQLAADSSLDITKAKGTLSNWSKDYVKIAENWKIIEKGEYDDKNLNTPITRMEMTKILANADMLMFKNDNEGDTKENFSDVKNTSKVELKYLNHCVKRGFLEGYEDGTFKPNIPMTRAEASTVIYRMKQQNKGKAKIKDVVPIPVYTVTFYNDDGKTVLSRQEVEQGKAATAPKTPTKAKTAEYTYTFLRWDADFSKITGDLNVRAVYSAVKNKYVITWITEDGKELKKESLDYGTKPVYTGAIPYKEKDETFTYKFEKWIPEVDTVTKDATYTAKFLNNENGYTVTFYDEDGETLVARRSVTPGESCELPESPTKAATEQYTYLFEKWDKVLTKVTENMSTKAVYEAMPNLVLNGTYNNIRFTYENVDGTTGWTNGNVKVKVTVNIKEKNYRLQTSLDGTTWEDANEQIVESNEDVVYCSLTDGTKRSNIVTTSVDNIDKTKPEVVHVWSTFANDESDEEFAAEIMLTDVYSNNNDLSGIVAYAITGTNEEPEEFESLQGTYEETTVNTNWVAGRYYLWVIDEAGNISDPYGVTIRGVNEFPTFGAQIWYRANEADYAKLTISGDSSSSVQYHVDDRGWTDNRIGVYPIAKDMQEGEVLYARIGDGVNFGRNIEVEMQPVFPRVLVNNYYYEVTPDNISQYVGRVVKNYNGDGKQWRLFYMDFGGVDANGEEWSTETGKYGEGYGTIYLKADLDTSNDGEVYKTELYTSSDYEEYIPGRIDIMKKMNPIWASNNGTIDTISERIASYFNDASLEEWNNKLDIRYLDQTKWIVGSPSIDLYCDAYCQKYGQGALVCAYSEVNAPGYLVGVNNSFENDNGFSTPNRSINGGAPWTYGFYGWTGFGHRMFDYYIASPSAYSERALVKGGGVYSGVWSQDVYPNVTYGQNATWGVCPIVCMDVEFSIY